MVQLLSTKGREMSPDLVNGLFELIGGFLCWLNVKKIYSVKQLVGVHWEVQAFFSAWGFWNLWYYPALDQWFSFWGALFIVSGNSTWVALAIYYTRRRNDD